MSLISEQVKLLRELQDNPEIDMVPIYEMNKACKEAADTIEDLSAKLATANMERSTAYYNGGWIPVEERLPGEDGEYLVWYDCGYKTENPSENDERGYMVVPFKVDIGAFGFCCDHYDSFTLGFVDSEFYECETAVAWMPLPEPYQPKGE